MKYLIIIFSLLALNSCTQKEFSLHEKGFEYLFHHQDPDNIKPELGDIMILNMDYYYNGDSLLFSTKELSTPFRMKLKKNMPTGETIDDALALMNIGDSASFKLNATLFYTITKHQKVPVKVKQDDQITFHVKLVRTIVKEKFEKEIRRKKQPDTIEKELDLLENYIKNSNITQEPTASGLYFIENQKGTGNKAKMGSQVTVHYSGYFINGENFSNTYESNQPFTFTLGKDELIAGFQEGILKMSGKGHYTLIIPSYIGYGSKGNQTIPANKTLIFEIDVLSIKN